MRVEQEMNKITTPACASHHGVLGSATTLRNRPLDILRRVFDVTRLAMEAILCVDHEPCILVGLGFNVNAVNVTMDAGPRFYVPGSYSGLDQRTDFAAEVELSVPIGDVTMFVHWQPTYSGTDAPGWGVGWQHHGGTGMSFSF